MRRLLEKALWITLIASLVAGFSMGVAAQDLHKVTVQIDGAAVPYYTPLYLAQAKGFFAEEGLDVEFLYGAAADIIRNAAVGNVEFGFPNADAVIAARASGIPVKVVHTTLQHGLGATIFKEDSGISTPEDLAGKRVAVTSYGSPNYIQLQVLLKQAGLTVDDIDLQIVGTGAIVNALVTDRVDAIVFSMLRTFELRYSGVAVAEWRSDDFLPSHGNVIVVGERYLEQNPDTVRAFNRALSRALQYMIDGNVREAIDLAVEHYLPTFEGQEEYFTDILTEVYVGYLWQTDNTREHGLGWADIDRWNESIRIMQEYDLVEGSLDAADFVTNDYLQ